MIYFRWNIFQHGNTVIGILSILIQTFCFISIAFVQLKYRLGEQKINPANVTKRMNLMYDAHIEELNVGKWFSFEVEKSSEDTCLPSISNVKDTTKQNQHGLQYSVTCNNMFVECCYAISFLGCSIVFAISTIVRNTMTLHDLSDYSPLILRILDLAPPMFLSIGLPLSIHARHPEIMKYFTRILCHK